MRKILLGTTAVVGLALVAQAANAQQARPAAAPVAAPATNIAIAPGSGGRSLTPAPAPSIAGAGGLTVRLGGYFEFSAANVQDDNDRAVNAKLGDGKARQRNDFRNDLELHVFVDGRAGNGMQYGAVLEFQMDNGAGTAGDNSNVSMDEAFGFIKGGWGEFRFGAEDSAASLLAVRAPAAGALGGDAVWDEFVVNKGLFSSPYITSGINDGNDSTKVVYLSPQFAGFDFGISYAPNSNEGERVDTSNGTAQQRDRTTLENEISVGLRYRGTFSGVGLQAGVGAMFADANTNNASLAAVNNEDVNAYFFGAQVAAFGFAVGGEYAFGSYNGSSVGRTALAKGLDDSSHWLVGATYTIGSVVLGAVYGQGSQDNGGGLKDRDHTVMGVGLLYNLAPGIGLFAAYNSISDENVPIAAPTATSTVKNIATFNGSTGRDIDVAMAGIRLAF
jgi:predicted porin